MLIDGCSKTSLLGSAQFLRRQTLCREIAEAGSRPALYPLWFPGSSLESIRAAFFRFAYCVATVVLLKCFFLFLPPAASWHVSLTSRSFLALASLSPSPPLYPYYASLSLSVMQRLQFFPPTRGKHEYGTLEKP